MSQTLNDQWLDDARLATKLTMASKRAMIPNGQKCSNCKNHRNHEFSNKYHYCKLGKSPHTPNGYAKTKASGWCAKWEAKL